MKKKIPEPMKPDEAKAYINAHNYQHGRVIVGSARAVAARMCSFLTQPDLEYFQQALYDENFDFAYQMLGALYDFLDEPVPTYVRAYFGDTQLTAVFLECLSSEMQIAESHLDAYRNLVKGENMFGPLDFDPPHEL